MWRLPPYLLINFFSALSNMHDNCSVSQGFGGYVGFLEIWRDGDCYLQEALYLLGLSGIRWLCWFSRDVAGWSFHNRQDSSIPSDNEETHLYIYILVFDECYFWVFSWSPCEFNLFGVPFGECRHISWVRCVINSKCTPDVASIDLQHSCEEKSRPRNYFESQMSP